MNYIYDITLNLKKDYYDFYEWREDDHPEFILKIPIFKIDDDAFLDIKNNNCMIDSSILSMIKNQTEVYSPSSVKIKKYACLLSCDEEVIGIEIDESGNIIKKSSLSIDEEDDILDMVSLIKCVVLKYKVSNKTKIFNIFKTRNEKEIIKRLEKRLNNLMIQKEYEFLKYIFYEVYNEKCNDINKIYIKILNIIKNCDYKTKKISEIFDLNSKEIMN